MQKKPKTAKKLVYAGGSDGRIKEIVAAFLVKSLGGELPAYS